MAKPTPWKDEYTLLCERCGYIIEDLDQALPCPECGKPITESLPERRIGTPWQQQPGFKSLLRTWWMTLRYPIQTLDTMRASCPIQLTKTIKHHLCISLLFVTPGSILISLFGEHFLLGLLAFPIYLGMSSIVILIIHILTRIESRGLRIIGKGKGFRISINISDSIVAHGSVGWAIALIGLGLYWNIYLISGILIKSENQTIQNFASNFIWSGLGMLTCSILIGFLFFETFAYLGLRRCKYANTLPPQSPPQKP